MKLRVSGMVWLPRQEFDAKALDYFRRSLTIIPRKLGDYSEEPPDPIPCYVETPAFFGVPRAFWFGTATREYEYEWDLSFGQPIKLEGSLTHEGVYAEQGEIVRLFDSMFENDGGRSWYQHNGRLPTPREVGLGLGGILQADTGFGKTDTALGIIRAVGVTALVITHKEFLRDQWIERARRWFPDIKVGIVQEKKCDFEGKDLVVAMVESLATDQGDRYPSELYSWPGLVVLDEVHRIGARTWAPVPPRFRSAWRLGLTATPRRKDDADKVFWWHIGEVVYRAKTETPKPIVRMIKVRDDNLPSVVLRDQVKSPVVINVITSLTRRNEAVITEAVKALSAPVKRKLLILSERLEHLRDLNDMLKARLRADYGDAAPSITTDFYVGEWFTGERTKKLAKKTWPMEDGGREEAIAVLYRDIRRKMENGAEDEDGPLFSEAEALALDLKEEEFALGHVDKSGHYLYLRRGTMDALMGVIDDSDEDGLVEFRLEDLDDAVLYDLAKEFKVRQRVVEKKKERTREELFEAERARVVFGTFQMMAEGIDIPSLDTLILASPVSDVEQAVGRIRRFCPPKPGKCEHFCPWRAGECQGKPSLVVADIVDIGIALSSKRESYRRTFYESLGTKVAG